MIGTLPVVTPYAYTPWTGKNFTVFFVLMKRFNKQYQKILYFMNEHRLNEG